MSGEGKPIASSLQHDELPEGAQRFLARCAEGNLVGKRNALSALRRWLTAEYGSAAASGRHKNIRNYFNGRTGYYNEMKNVGSDLEAFCRSLGVACSEGEFQSDERGINFVGKLIAKSSANRSRLASLAGEYLVWRQGIVAIARARPESDFDDFDLRIYPDGTKTFSFSYVRRNPLTSDSTLGNVILTDHLYLVGTDKDSIARVGLFVLKQHDDPSLRDAVLLGAQLCQLEFKEMNSVVGRRVAAMKLETPRGSPTEQAMTAAREWLAAPHQGFVVDLKSASKSEESA